MIKITLLILAFFPLITALTAGVNPSKIDFTGNTDEKICRNMTLFGEGEFAGEDYWSIVPTRELKDYTLDSEDFDIKISYPKNLIINKKESIRICIDSKKEGIFYGAVIFSQSNAGAGSWITVKIKNGDFITGNSIGGRSSKPITAALVFILAVLAITCILLLKNNFLKKKSLENYGKETKNPRSS